MNTLKTILILMISLVTIMYGIFFISLEYWYETQFNNISKQQSVLEATKNDLFVQKTEIQRLEQEYLAAVQEKTATSINSSTKSSANTVSEQSSSTTTSSTSNPSSTSTASSTQKSTFTSSSSTKRTPVTRAS